MAETKAEAKTEVITPAAQPPRYRVTADMLILASGRYILGQVLDAQAFNGRKEINDFIELGAIQLD